MSSADDPLDARAEREIIELLAAQPRPTMPPEVRARIDAALAAEVERRRTEPAKSPAAPARGRRMWLAAAAAVAVLGLAGLVTVPRLGQQAATPEPATMAAFSPSPTPGCAEAESPAAELGAVLSRSGTSYTAAAFATQAQALLTRSCDPLAVRAAQGRYAIEDGTEVQGCVVAAAAGRVVLAVDVGRYDGRPAVVILLAPREALALDCQHEPATVLARTQVP